MQLVCIDQFSFPRYSFVRKSIRIHIKNSQVIRENKNRLIRSGN